MLLGASPDDGVVSVGEHEADAHDAEVFADVDGLPAGTGLMHFTVDDAHHAGDGGAADIDIEDADLQRWIGGGDDVRACPSRRDTRQFERRRCSCRRRPFRTGRRSCA